MANLFGIQHRIHVLLPVLILAVMMAEPTVAAINKQDAIRVQHQSPTVIERDQPVPLSFDIPAIDINQVQDASVFYRFDGDMAYSQLRARMDQTTFRAELNVQNSYANSLEYYLQVEMNDGRRITYPAQQPSSNPVRVDIVDPVNRTARNQTGIDYTILSPDPGSTLRADDVLLAITLFYEEGAIDTTTSSFRMLLDEQDITESAATSDYFFSYSPENIAPGPHKAHLQLVTSSDTATVTEWEFSVLDPNQTYATREQAARQDEVQSFVPEGEFELTAQNQQVGGIDNDVLKGNLEMSGRKGDIRYSAHGLLTSQESDRLQPQNRYGAELYVGDWLELQGGHIYPSMSRLTISGRRVQGINTELHAFDGAVNAQFLYGKMNRKITNLYNPVQPSVTRQSDGTPVDTTYALGFQNGGRGTFKRNITGGRLSVGRGRTFQWGLNILQVRDDTTSLATIRDFGDLMTHRPQLVQNLELQFRNDLQANPDLLSVSGNPQPKDNVVGGSDLMFNLFDNTLRFRSETSVSLLNEDISSGILSNTEEFDIDLSEETINELDRWSWLIIINENMNTLPLRFQVENGATTVESAFFPTSILANESQMNLNLGNNSFRAQYRWIGPNYVSLANSTIRRDLAGITLTDRFQLFQNRLYVTVGYENLNDNVSGTKDATTITQTGRTNLSWFPIDQYLPRVSVGFRYRNRDNSVPLNNPFLDAGTPQDIAVRNFLIAQGDTSITANPRLSNTAQITSSVSQQFNLFDMSHDASLNFSYTDTKDDLFRYGDTRSSTFNFNIQSRFETLPLNTKVGVNFNTTETLGGLSDVDIFGFNIGGSLFLMDEKLNIDTNLAFTRNEISSTTLAISDNGTADARDDIYQPQTDGSGNPVTERTKNHLVVIRTGAQYNLNANHAFMLNFNYTNIANQLSSINPPNDHRLQARYIFRF